MVYMVLARYYTAGKGLIMATWYVEVDEGNATIKVSDGNKVISFVHALRPVGASEWNQVLARSGKQGAGSDYIQVYESKRSKKATPYVLAETAQKSGFRDFQQGARRYVPEYYGVLLCKALNMILKDKRFEDADNSEEIVILATHAPHDIGFAQNLVDAAQRLWKIQVGQTCYYYNVVAVETIEEPVGGLFNYTLDPDGKAWPRKDIFTVAGDVLMLDIGGYTTDFEEADERGVPRTQNAKSITSGVIKAKTVFRELMREAYPDWLTNADSITDAAIERAFRGEKGKARDKLFWGSGRSVDCSEQVTLSVSPLLSEIMAYYRNEFKNGVPYGTIILTGGGCGLLHTLLVDALQHDHIHLADSIDKIQYANVKGASKLRKMLVRKGYM